jgi:hypothetical protein
MVLELNKAPQRPVVSAGAVVGKAAGLIVIILETLSKARYNCLLPSTFRFTVHTFGVAEKWKGLKFH